MDSGGMGSVQSLIQLAVLRHCSSINWPAPPAQRTGQAQQKKLDQVFRMLSHEMLKYLVNCPTLEYFKTF